MDSRFDIVVVGAGMAGASLAARLSGTSAGHLAGPLAGRPSVLVVEHEDRPGYHATGRSAAFWTESYGGPGVQPLTAASGPELRALGKLAPRAALTLGRAGEEAEVERFARVYGDLGVEVHVLDRARIEARVPGLRDTWTSGVLEPSTCDIDVAGLHQHYLAAARREGVEIRCRAGLRAATRTASGWTLTLADGAEVACKVLVNAAGAWADPVARLAGVSPLGITPYRRTVAQLAVGRPVPDDLPLVLDVGETFYFKPEHGRLWLSPHDETPSVPCDAAPEELDVALAIDRLEHVVDWPVERVEHRWAGLRSFAPDRLPVYGFDPADPAFFWFAGQGGFGIQTAPAAAALGASLLMGGQGGDLDPAPYAPDRFVTA